MTLQAVGAIPWPATQLENGPLSTTLARTNIAFDSDTDRIAWVGGSQYTDSIATIYFRTGNVTTGCILNVRVETVTNGRPSGTLWNLNSTGTTPAASVTVDNADDNVWKTATLTDVANLVAGDEFAIIFTVDTAGDTPNMQFSVVSNRDSASFSGIYPILMVDTGAGTWAYTDNSIHMVVAMTTAGVVSFSNMSPQEGSGTIHAPTSASAPDEYAAKFVAPFKGRLIGAQIGMFNIAAGADFTVSLWPSSSSVDGDALAQVSVDGDFPIATTDDGNVFIALPATTLTAGTTYYLGVRADTANAIGVGSYTVTTVVANAIRGYSIGANTFNQATREWTAGTAGAWTDNTTVFPLVSLIFDQLDDGAGGAGGGMLVHPGMNGRKV